MNESNGTLRGMGGAKADVRVGLDVGDKTSTWSALEQVSGELREGLIQTTPEGVRGCFEGLRPLKVVMEAGAHSPWLAQLMGELGHHAVVVPADALVQGGRRRRKNDQRDARLLRELAEDLGRRQVPQVWQRPLQYQEDLTLMRMRDVAVRARGMLANAVRGAVKPYGERIAKHSVESLPKFARTELSERTLRLVEPTLKLIEVLTKEIRASDREVKRYLARRPESERLLEAPVGPVTVGVFMALIGEPERFCKSRVVPAYVGMVPGQYQSGDADPQLRISKAGDELLRRSAMQCAQRLMSKKGEDCQLRRWAWSLAGDGKNKVRKKKATVALARKLLVLLHHLWITGKRYDPWYGTTPPKLAIEEAPAA